MRLWRRSIAWLILAGFLSAQAAVWVAAHHDTLEDDAACAGIDGPQLVGPHHQDGIQFEETDSPNPIEHCALCHLQRAVNNARLARVATANTAPHVVSVAVELKLALSLVVVPGFSPRGPPASIL